MIPTMTKAENGKISVAPAVRFAVIAGLLCVVLPLYLATSFAGLPGLVSVAMGLLTLLFYYGEAPRHAYREIPGPPSKWLIGNLDLFVKLGGYHKAYEQLCKDYGRVARIQMGHWPQIIVQDPALIKEICLENFSVFQVSYYSKCVQGGLRVVT